MARQYDIRVRRGTASGWTTANTILADGEIGLEKDTGLFKFGNGADSWTNLSYAAITTAQGDTRYLLASSKGQPSGVATLGTDGKLTPAQLPGMRLVNVSVVANQAARLALPVDDDAQFVVQSDIAATFVLPAGGTPTSNANWVQLPQPSISGLEQTANKDVANGYAGLDSSGKLKQAQFPTIDGGTP